MRRQSPSRSLPLILLLCIVALAIGLVLVLPTPATNSPRYVQTNVQIPEFISITQGEISYATASATLMTSDSYRLYMSTPSPFQRMKQFLVPAPITPQSPFDTSKVSQWVSSVALQLHTEPVEPYFIATASSSLVSVNPGRHGISVDQEQTVHNIQSVDISATNSASLAILTTGVTLTPDTILEAEHFASKLLGKTIKIQSPHFSKTLSTKEILGLLLPPTELSPRAIGRLTETINLQVATVPVEPVLTINGDVVSQFIAPKNGQQVDETNLRDDLSSKIIQLTQAASVKPIDLSFQTSEPKHSLADVNTLGISERIGIGESEYAHSIPNRVKNVSLTTSKIHAKIVNPGQEFSFNQYLGEVSAKTGFLPAYVIKEGQTVLGDGGGVCQVSSTLFRAVLNSGLPVTERRGHSYRVGYYEENSKPGFDATVYSPHPDFRFRNDTDTPILVNAVADPKTLSMYIELWGKSDGRKAEVINYKQWDAQPAPAPMYQDDPTLPPGKLKQIDFAAPGLKTSFDYVVTYPDGRKQTKNFATSYIPWRAVYLRGV